MISPPLRIVQRSAKDVTSRRVAATLALLVTVSLGCRSVEPTKNVFPVAPEIVPRELDKVTLPDYIIEPPDILTIAAINLVPKSPYYLQQLDAVRLQIQGPPPEVELSGDFIIQPSGDIQLAYGVGRVNIAGMTVEQAEQAIQIAVAREFRDPLVALSISRVAAQQEVAGEHLVAPDGRINLGSYGRVRVVGMTIEQAKEAIEAQLSGYLEDPRVSVDIFGFNSKVYYVITQGAGLGDQVIVLPFRGNETALDAIGQIQGLRSNSSTRMWIARPNRVGCGECQVLPMNWEAITQCADTSTNYQILPGDRVYVAQDHLVAIDTAIAKLFSPIERLMGVTLLSTQTVRLINFFNNAQFNGGGGGI